MFYTWFLTLIIGFGLIGLGCQSPKSTLKESTVDQELMGGSPPQRSAEDLSQERPRPGLDQEPLKSQNP